MRRLAQLLHALSHGCGKLPLLAALALIASSRLTPVLIPPGPPPGDPVLVVENLPEDFQIIDAVLSKRAPELGLILRRQLAVAISEEALRAGYDPLLILAIIDVESDFEEEAVSRVGAKGLMQIRPSTLHFLAQKEGLRLSREEVAGDPALCVRLGVRYLRDLQSRFNDDLDLALMAYNAGPSRIRSALKGKEMPEVFKRYPRLVRRDFRRFREGEGLGGDWALAQRAEEEPAP
jgi:soluble lytic murein transglycosylase